VGGTFTAPDYLQLRRTGGPCADCLDSYFTAAQSCYAGYSSNLDAQPDNANANVTWSCLLITCDNPNYATYYIHLTPDQLNAATYYSTSNCNFQAEWVITISGTEDVNFHGDQFPAPDGAVLFNIVGSGRTITAGTGVLGHILAPYNTLNQQSGVIIGKVVAQNISFSTQINKPDCYNPGDVTIQAPVLAPSGSTSVVIPSDSGFEGGEDVDINGNSYACSSVTSTDSGDTLTFTSTIPYVPEGTQISTSVDGTKSGQKTSSTSDASVTSVFCALVLALAVFL